MKNAIKYEIMVKNDKITSFAFSKNINVFKMVYFLVFITLLQKMSLNQKVPISGSKRNMNVDIPISNFRFPLFFLEIGKRKWKSEIFTKNPLKMQFPFPFIFWKSKILYCNRSQAEKKNKKSIFRLFQVKSDP